MPTCGLAAAALLQLPKMYVYVMAYVSPLFVN